MAFLMVLALLAASCGGDEIDRLAANLNTSGHYDDFSGSAVDLTKWAVSTGGGGVISLGGGAATLQVNTFGGAQNSMLSFPSTLATSIGSMTVAVTPTAYSEDPLSNVRFRMFLRSYKDNKYTGTGLTSDVVAQIRMRGGFWQAMVSRCTDAACASEIIHGPVNLGAANLNQTYIANMTWDGNTSYTFNLAGLGSSSFNADGAGILSNIGASSTPSVKLESIVT